MSSSDPSRSALELASQLQGASFEGVRSLAAGVAHDFNNLLAVILSCSEFAEQALDAASPEAEALRDSREAALRAAELCRLILAFAGKRSAVSSTVDIAAAIAAAIAAISIPDNVRVELISPVTSPSISADPELIDQLLHALLENAISACSPAGGNVVVTLSRDDGVLLLEVRDDGVGMDEATRARAFEPFFTTRFPRRGLGLSAAHGIACSHDGTIELSSELGVGTLVRVSLPSFVRRERERPATSPLEGDRKRKVLVVDDEPLVARAVTRILKATGLVVDSVHSGGEAIARLELGSKEYDLVILDMTMPGLDGAETFRRIRALRPDIRVLLSSGYHHLDSTEALVSSGNCWFLAKPYEADALLELVDLILELGDPRE